MTALTTKYVIVVATIVAVLVPIAYRLFVPASIRAKICPIVSCIGSLSTCVQLPSCRRILDCLQECYDESSMSRKMSAEKYSYLQFPDDPNLCRYQCFDRITDDETENFIECVGESGCLEFEIPYSSDRCAEQISQNSVLPFSSIPADILEGRWTKILTNSWDVWPCQSTEFFRPGAADPPPKPWMEQWPNQPNVWRMDYSWTITDEEKDDINNMYRSTPRRTFMMNNEIYPSMRWHYPNGVPAFPTAKTRAVMWGTEAHENWYLLDVSGTTDSDKDDPKKPQSILMHVCAYTPAVKSYDAITLVLVKNDGDEVKASSIITDEFVKEMQRKAVEILGEEYGKLRRIEDCTIINYSS